MKVDMEVFIASTRFVDGKPEYVYGYRTFDKE